MTELKNTYISVKNGSGFTYGGSQGLSDNVSIQKCGCGIVAAADLILYMRNFTASTPLSLQRYNKFLKYLKRHYLPLIPKFGMNSLSLTVGLNLYFANNKLPYRASWLLSGDKFYSRLENQLSENIPVIMSVGPNFPCFWQKNNLDLYTKINNNYVKTASARAHYVTATGIDENYIRISSWGRELYISRREFSHYMCAHSNSFLCNMLKISKG